MRALSSFWIRESIVQAMFTQYQPTDGYDEYFSREQSTMAKRPGLGSGDG